MNLEKGQDGRKEGKLTPFGREWRIESRSELVAATIGMDHFEGPEHGHSEAQVSVLLAGPSATFSRRGVSGSIVSPVTPGSFVYIPPDELHRTQWHGWTELLNLYWTDDFLLEFADQNGCALYQRSSSYRMDQAIQSVGRILMDESLATGILSEMMIDHGRALVASRLFRMCEQGTRGQATGLLSQKRLQKAIDALAASPEQSFTLMDLARLCHSSVFHFSRSFTARVGCAPFAFQRNLRMQKARDLLAGTELSVQAISYAVGIDSPTSFSRMFRRASGQSPTDFRRLHLMDVT